MRDVASPTHQCRTGLAVVEVQLATGSQALLADLAGAGDAPSERLLLSLTGPAIGYRWRSVAGSARRPADSPSPAALADGRLPSTRIAAYRGNTD